MATTAPIGPHITYIRFAGSGGVEIDGATIGNAGQHVYLFNDTADVVDLLHDSGSGSEAEGFECPDASTFRIYADAWTMIVYDSDTQRWRVVTAIGA